MTTEEFAYQLIIRGLAAALAAGVANEARYRGGPVLWGAVGAALGFFAIIPLLIGAFFRRPEPPTTDQ